MLEQLSEIELPANQKFSSDPGPKPVLEWIDIDHLRLDHSYQRGLSQNGMSVIRRILADFEWRKFQPITVSRSPNSNELIVIDGQHRAIAAAHHPEVKQLPAWIIDADDIVTQARSFGAINKNRTPITAAQQFRADVIAGDKTALEVQSCLDDAGVEIPRNNPPNGLKPHQTQAVSTIRKCVHKFRKETVITALEAMIEAEVPLRGQSITAVAQLIANANHHDLYDYDHLVTVLGGCDLETMLEAARNQVKSLGGNVVNLIVQSLINKYNSGRSGKNRIPNIIGG